MKVRIDFVTNSSSSSFLIVNKSSKDLTLIDFVEENEHLLRDFVKSYSCDDGFNLDQMLIDAAERNEIFKANSSTVAVYGDEQGDVLGCVYDYILRDGGESRNFRWSKKESLR